MMVSIDEPRQYHLVPATNTHDGRVLAAEFLVGTDLDNSAVLLKHGAIRDLVPAVAIDRMSHHGATADQRCRHLKPPWCRNWQLASGSLGKLREPVVGVPGGLSLTGGRKPQRRRPTPAEEPQYRYRAPVGYF